jgi:hypothetical protein
MIHILPLRIYPKECKSAYDKWYLHTDFVVTLFTTAQLAMSIGAYQPMNGFLKYDVYTQWSIIQS